MDNSRVHLSDIAREAILKICKRIEEKNADNNTAVTMSRNMATVARTNRSLSQKQLNWLADNARRKNIKWPAQLAKLVGANRGASSSDFSAKTVETLLKKMLRRLSNIEELLNRA